MDEFQHFEPFPPETRMKMPEMSYEQELLNTPIPFENRVAFLSEYLKVTSEESTFEQLALNLDIAKSVLSSILGEIEAPFTQLETGEIVYNSRTEEVVAEELHWRNRFSEFDDFMSAASIASNVSKGIDSVHELANGLGVYLKFEEVGKRKFYRYPKELAQKLHTLAFHFPPANDWYNPTEAEVEVGKDREWIEAQVALHGLKTGMRMSGNNNMISHYPAETIAALVSLVEKLPPPAGDWMTARSMASLLNRSRDWVVARLVMYRDLAEDRLTDIHTVKLHYPPQVFLTLKQLSDNLPPPADGWVNRKEVSEMLVRTRHWVDKRIGSVGIASEMRLDRKEISRIHYSPEIIDTLQLKYLIDEENGLEV